MTGFSVGTGRRTTASPVGLRDTTQTSAARNNPNNIPEARYRVDFKFCIRAILLQLHYKQAFFSLCQSGDQPGKFADSLKVTRHILVRNWAETKFLIQRSKPGFTHEIQRTRAVLQQIFYDGTGNTFSLVFRVYSQ